MPRPDKTRLAKTRPPQTSSVASLAQAPPPISCKLSPSAPPIQFRPSALSAFGEGKRSSCDIRMSHLPRFCPSDADFALDAYRQVVNCALVRESRREWVALTAPHILNISSNIPESEQIYRPSPHFQELSTHTDDHPHKLSPPPFPTITLTDLNLNNALAGPQRPHRDAQIQAVFSTSRHKTAPIHTKTNRDAQKPPTYLPSRQDYNRRALITIEAHSEEGSYRQPPPKSALRKRPIVVAPPRSTPSSKS